MHQRTNKGARTRDTILAHAVDLASAEGLEGLTIGGLAASLDMSKSGLFAHFGSKEDLQLATVERAGEIFSGKVLRPADSCAPGIARLQALMRAWLTYVEDSGFRGGCFFAAASAEFDGRPGPVRERVAELTKWWRDLLLEHASVAQEQDELRADVDPKLLAFALHAYAQEANWAYQLLGDGQAFDHARAAADTRIRDNATRTGLILLDQMKTDDS